MTLISRAAEPDAASLRALDFGAIVEMLAERTAFAISHELAEATLPLGDLNMDIGQFYAVTLDNRDPYHVYGGLQDNGNWGGPSNSRDWNGILNDHWFKFHSGDGFHTTVDPDDWRTVYTEAQGGAISRFDAVFRQGGASPTPARS
jgi:hypothetical protein